MNFRRACAAALMAAALPAAGGLRAAPLKIDHHLRSVPANMVSGFFAADTPPVLLALLEDCSRLVPLARPTFMSILSRLRNTLSAMSMGHNDCGQLGAALPPSSTQPMHIAGLGNAEIRKRKFVPLGTG